jgi:hypothetical protein
MAKEPSAVDVVFEYSPGDQASGCQNRHPEKCVKLNHQFFAKKAIDVEIMWKLF